MQLTIARFAALAVAVAAWSGLVVQFIASTGLTGSIGQAIWSMVRYFTVITNLLVAGLFTAIALGHDARPKLIGMVSLAILLVGIVYATMLRGLIELSGGAALADFLLHSVTPVMVPLWWLAFAPRGGLGWRDPWQWALLPLAYFAYALARGGIEGRYAYPFMDVASLGWPAVLSTAGLMAAGFVVGGYALIAISAMRADRGGPFGSRLSERP
ncbi:MAG: Pr6Pr family membrane protein [Pseudomonadota bacterium]|nr:Pr6Pr family membrane protein [Pseudomonadota bacterium]